MFESRLNLNGCSKIVAHDGSVPLLSLVSIGCLKLLEDDCENSSNVPENECG